MAADVEVEMSFVGTRGLEGTLVAPRTTKPVPNHLSDTKIFAKASKNCLLQTQPGVIHFDGYTVGKVHHQTLRIINASKDNQQMHIISPTTPFFSIKYSKQVFSTSSFISQYDNRSSLVPGLSLEVTVHFKPNEWRYYYDCIRIHCKGDQNLLVPIHAYPVMNTAQFPKSVKFPPTAIGQSKTKTLSLECGIPIDFEFQLLCLQPHPAFTVTPMKGVVPANGRVDITVTFAPTEFTTAILKLQLELSQFNSSPLVCTITGSSAPGLAIEQVKKSALTARAGASQAGSTKTRSLPHLERTRQRKRDDLRQSRRLSSNATLPSKQKKEVVYEGIHFPALLDTPSVVGKILAQQSGKMKASELRQAASETGLDAGSHQVKEAVFLQQVRQAVAEERTNQLRWVTQLGDVAMTAGERGTVLQARQEADRAYQRHCHVAVPEEEYLRSTTKCVLRRTRRKAREQPSHAPKFDSYSNDRWLRRHLVLQRFVQAGRRVVVQLRCQRRLERIKKVGADLQAGKTLEEALADLSRKDHQSVLSVVSQLPKSSNHILPFSFPKYTSKINEDTPDTLGPVEVKPTSVEVKKEVLFFKLKVPQQYKLLGYSPHPIPQTGSYIPPGLPRPLRSGAQDELQNLGHIPGVDPSFISALTTGLPSSSAPSPQLATDTAEEIRVVDVEGLTKEGEMVMGEEEKVVDDAGGGEYLPLVPPPTLFKPPQRHSLHIFAPCPGVSSYVSMLPNSETTLGHTLLPLPPYPTARHPQVQLDPQDVIPGVMRWKQFPSHCLLTLEGEKKLSTVWKPRWSDPFSDDLLPHVEPHLLSGPQPEDYVDESSSEVLPVPTLEMVRAQFYVPDPGTEQQDPRVVAEEELRNARCKQFNQLGQKIRQRLHTMQSLLIDSRMKTITEEDNPT